MSSFSEMINRLPFEVKSDISPDTIELLDSMSGIGATATIPNQSQSQFDLLIKFK